MLPRPLHESLNELIKQLEDLWIEKEAYRQLLLLSLTVTVVNLQELQAEALADPVRRANVRQLFSDMRKTLVEAGHAAEIEELLSQPLKPGKPS